MGCSPLAIAAGWVRSQGAMPEWLRTPDRKIYLTHQGRTAVGLLCELLRLGSGHEALLPSYNCGAEIDPFRAAGCRLRFYRIDETAQIDVADINARISPETRLVYVSHFFGWPQDLAELSDVCRNRGIILVEDCAQALFANPDETGIGKWGDAVIFSFVKFLAVPDGGALLLKANLPSAAPKTESVPLRQTVKASLPLFKKDFMQTNRLWQKWGWSRRMVNRSYGGQQKRAEDCGRPAMLSSNIFNERERHWGISQPSLGILRTSNVEEIVARRRQNFLRLGKQLEGKTALRPLYESLPPGVCPFVFPVIAENPLAARSCFEQNGIAVQGWPGYYPGVDWDEFPETCLLKDRVMGLPVHQFIDDAQIDYIGECASQIECRGLTAAAGPATRDAQFSKQVAC
jgi:dTDP-4-amino-4,6-dideoxygalactose transaminase